MKVIIALSMMVISTSIFAVYVGSPVKGGYVSYLAEAGSTVKKGQPLFKLRYKVQKMLITKHKLNLKSAMADLKDKKSDMKRSDDLISKDAISLAMHENYVVEYYKSLLKTERLKIKVEQSVYDLESFVGKAPYDCKVIKQLVCTNSGTDHGTYLLEIQHLETKVATDSSALTLKLTAGMNEQITYIAKENQIVKKGELLVKFDSTIPALKLKILKSSLKEANQCLIDAKTDIARSKELVKNNTIPPKLFEDAEYLFTKCEVDVDFLKLEIKDLKYKINTNFVYLAPYDLKVVKQVLSVDSGTNDGNPMLLVQKI